MTNKIVYDKLKEVARKGLNNNLAGIIFYEEIMALAGLDRGDPADRLVELCGILDEINRVEDAKGNPMITAIVVHKHDKMPGKGFFTLARDLGRLSNQKEDTFWFDEIKNVWLYWSTH